MNLIHELDKSYRSGRAMRWLEFYDLIESVIAMSSILRANNYVYINTLKKITNTAKSVSDRLLSPI